MSLHSDVSPHLRGAVLLVFLAVFAVALPACHRAPPAHGAAPTHGAPPIAVLAAEQRRDAPDEVVPTPQMAAPKMTAYPPLHALGRLRRLRLGSAPSEVIDGDLHTGVACASASPGCTVRFVLSRPARVEVLRLFVVRSLSDAAEEPPLLSIDMQGPGLRREFSAPVTDDFIHRMEALELPAGDYSLTIKSSTPSEAALKLQDLALFGETGEHVAVDWTASSMFVKAQGPFYKPGPEHWTLSTGSFAEEFDHHLKAARRFPASEVFPIDGTAYAIVRRDGQVSCGGAYHDYQQTYLILDSSSGLLVHWQDTNSALLHQNVETKVIRSEAYSIVDDSQRRRDLDLGALPPNIVETQISEWTSETSPEGAPTGWLPLGVKKDASCRSATALEAGAFALAVPATAEVDLREFLLSCPLLAETRLLIYSDTCSTEFSGAVVARPGKVARIDEGEPSSIELRRAPGGQWLVSVWQNDASRIYEVKADGTWALLLDNAAFGTRQVERCRCSA